MSKSPYLAPPVPKPPLRHFAIRFDPADSHRIIAELCLREREEHNRGQHRHIDFIPKRAS